MESLPFCEKEMKSTPVFLAFLKTTCYNDSYQTKKGGTFIMCGIVGYVGSRNCTDVLINGLTKLEYRGYDSAGIAVFSE